MHAAPTSGLLHLLFLLPEVFFCYSLTFSVRPSPLTFRGFSPLPGIMHPPSYYCLADLLIVPSSVQTGVFIWFPDVSLAPRHGTEQLLIKIADTRTWAEHSRCHSPAAVSPSGGPPTQGCRVLSTEREAGAERSPGLAQCPLLLNYLATRFLMRVLDAYGDDYRASQLTIVLEDEGSQGTDAPTPGNAENEPPEKEGLSPPRRTPAPPEPSSPTPGEGPSGRKRRRAPRDGRRAGAVLTPELAPIKVEEDFGFEADEALDSSWVSRGPDKLLPYPTLASPPFD
ncbi:TCF3 fusion partner isoform 2-T2 [Lycaon pictus]